jgi:hypothetical protein
VAANPFSYAVYRLVPRLDRGELRCDAVDGGAERQCRGKEVDAEVRPRTRGEQVLDLGVGLGPAERRVHLGQRELGHGQAERARQLPHDDLGDQRERPLTRAAELQDVQAIVVGLHQAGHRPALAQRRDVPRGGDGAQGGDGGHARDRSARACWSRSVVIRLPGR